MNFAPARLTVAAASRDLGCRKEAEEEEEMVMFNNPKTSITGYLMLAASLLMVVAHGLSGALGGADLTALLGAAGGVGLISAKDGGH